MNQCRFSILLVVISLCFSCIFLACEGDVTEEEKIKDGDINLGGDEDEDTDALWKSYAADFPSNPALPDDVIVQYNYSGIMHVSEMYIRDLTLILYTDNSLELFQRESAGIDETISSGYSIRVQLPQYQADALLNQVVTTLPSRDGFYGSECCDGGGATTLFRHNGKVRYVRYKNNGLWMFLQNWINIWAPSGNGASCYNYEGINKEIQFELEYRYFDISGHHNIEKQLKIDKDNNFSLFLINADGNSGVFTGSISDEYLDKIDQVLRKKDYQKENNNIPCIETQAECKNDSIGGHLYFKVGKQYPIIYRFSCPWISKTEGLRNSNMKPLIDTMDGIIDQLLSEQ